MRLLDEVLIQVRIKSDDLDRATLADLADLLIAFLTITVTILKVFADLTIGLVRALEWLADASRIEITPVNLARWWLNRLRFVPPIG